VLRCHQQHTTNLSQQKTCGINIGSAALPDIEEFELSLKRGLCTLCIVHIALVTSTNNRHSSDEM
jgi:hypothetical protein